MCIRDSFLVDRRGDRRGSLDGQRVGPDEQIDLGVGPERLGLGRFLLVARREADQLRRLREDRVGQFAGQEARVDGFNLASVHR
eukprot:2562408-Prymnesium_polylepis.1